MITLLLLLARIKLLAGDVIKLACKVKKDVLYVQHIGCNPEAVKSFLHVQCESEDNEESMLDMHDEFGNIVTPPSRPKPNKDKKKQVPKRVTRSSASLSDPRIDSLFD